MPSLFVSITISSHLKDKLTLDLSHYIWKSVVGLGDISCCKFFLIVKGVQYPKFSNLVKKFSVL